MNIGILYIGLHNQLEKKYGENGIFTRKEFFCKLGKHYIVPKNIRELVIREMEEKKLLHRIDRDHIKVLKCEIDLTIDAGKLYQLAGIT